MAAKKDNLGYWERRAIEQDSDMHKALNKPEQVINKAHLAASNWLTDQVNQIYRRYFSAPNMTEAQAKKILNGTVSNSEIVQLIQLIKDTKSKAVKKQLQQFISAYAAKSRITQFELLKAKVEIVSKQVAQVEQDQMDKFFIPQIQQAYDQAAVEAVIGQTTHDVQLHYPDAVPNIPTIDEQTPTVEFIDPKTNETVKTVELVPDKPITEFKRMSTSQVDKVMRMNWKGSNYSKRIWKNTDLLADQLKELFTAREMSGMSERDMAKALQERFEVSMFNARRLIRTEAAFVSNQARLMGWRENGVKSYVLNAVLDERTSKICRLKDGKHFPIEDAVCDGPDGNYPPFHSFCRTVAVAYFGKDTFVGHHLVNNPIGHSFEMPAGTTYQQWEKALINKYGGRDNYDRLLAEKQSETEDRALFDQYTPILGDDMTKDFQAWQDLRYNGGRDWQLTKLDYQRKERLLNNSDLRLPNADGATIDNRKFTEYLFNENSKSGYPKGKIISERFGYSKDNYLSFKKEILKRSKSYPAKCRGTNKYGDSYEQKMIFYTPKGKPYNLVAGWLVDGNQTKLTTIMIKEVK